MTRPSSGSEEALHHDPHCPFLLHPYSLQRPLSSHLPIVCCQLLCPSFSLAICSYGKGKVGRESLALHPGPSCPSFIRENQIAAATAAPAEINGNWQGNLLFFQSWILPSKHKDPVENGCCGGVGFGVERIVPHTTLTPKQYTCAHPAFSPARRGWLFSLNTNKMLNRKPFRIIATDKNQMPASLLSEDSSSNPTFWDLEMPTSGSAELSQRTWREVLFLAEGLCPPYPDPYQSGLRSGAQTGGPTGSDGQR